MIWLARKIELYEDDALVAEPRIVSTRVSLESDRSFDSLRAGAGARDGPAADRTTRRSSGSRGSSTCSSSIRFSRIDRISRSTWRFDRLGHQRRHRAALPAAWRRRARLTSSKATRASCRSIRAGTRRCCASSASGSSTSSTAPITCCSCSAWSSRSAASAHARADRHRVHRGAFDHADRVRLRLRAGRAVVSAADRNADRDVDRLHGAREHRRSRTLRRRWIDHVRLRPRARLRLLVRPAAHAAVRGLASADVAARRSTSASSSGSCWCSSLIVPALDAALPLRRRRAHGHDHPLGARRPHGVALDDRALRRAAAVSVAAADGRGCSQGGIRWLMALIAVVGVAWLLSRLAARKAKPQIPRPKSQHWDLSESGFELDCGFWVLARSTSARTC